MDGALVRVDDPFADCHAQSGARMFRGVEGLEYAGQRFSFHPLAKIFDLTLQHRRSVDKIGQQGRLDSCRCVAGCYRILQNVAKQLSHAVSVDADRAIAFTSNRQGGPVGIEFRGEIIEG